MKIIIQIPCFNEEKTLPQTLAELPRKIEGIDLVEWLIIDDGSTDHTAEVAHDMGVDHIIRHNGNKGLAAAFQTGLNACLQLSADIIVNTDADNQYPGRYVSDLVLPILDRKVDMVIADRQTEKVESFSFSKKIFQRLGSGMVRRLSGTSVPDAPSGFRAISREAALRINVLTDFTYTIETIIQAGKKNLKIENIKIKTNAPQRESRLIRSNWQYILRSSTTMIKIFSYYEPLRTFTYISIPFFILGIALWGRFFLKLLLSDIQRGAHIQSIVVGSGALVIGFLIFLMGMLSDIVGINRRLQEDILYHLKCKTLSKKDDSGNTLKENKKG
ncbi:MAG: glycosyltransferase family 2 protein [Candidatus Scalindua sp.]